MKALTMMTRIVNLTEVPISESKRVFLKTQVSGNRPLKGAPVNAVDKSKRLQRATKIQA